MTKPASHTQIPFAPLLFRLENKQKKKFDGAKICVGVKRISPGADSLAQLPQSDFTTVLIAF